MIPSQMIRSLLYLSAPFKPETFNSIWVSVETWVPYSQIYNFKFKTVLFTLHVTKRIPLLFLIFNQALIFTLTGRLYCFTEYLNKDCCILSILHQETNIFHPVQSKDIIYKYVVVFTVVACSLTLSEIQQDWQWLQENLYCLSSFEKEEDVTEFVCCKINSMIANSQNEAIAYEGNVSN